LARCTGLTMSIFMQILILLAMAAVVVALFLGLRNMMRQGDANLSNKLMQLRVFLQFIAVVLIVIAVYFFRPA
jgi:succinate dehydrogenase/fumarate reductase cytochrome b subunit